MKELAKCLDKISISLKEKDVYMFGYDINSDTGYAQVSLFSDDDLDFQEVFQNETPEGYNIEIVSELTFRAGNGYKSELSLSFVATADNDVFDIDEELLKQFEEMLNSTGVDKEEEELTGPDWDLGFEDPHGDVDIYTPKAGDKVRYAEPTSHHGLDSKKPFIVVKHLGMMIVLTQDGKDLMVSADYLDSISKWIEKDCDCGAKHTSNANFHTDYCSTNK